MRVDLHNHTYLCNHATGEVEEYVQKAIELGIDVYGFSEHAPMKNFDDGYRLTLEKKEFYEDMIVKLREKYQGQIEILLGYEVDFIEGDYILDSIKNAPVDYLLGSVHYIGKWGFDNPEFIKEYETRNIDQVWIDYFDAVHKMAKTGYFDIVSHMDLIKLFKFFPKQLDMKSILQPVLKTIKQTHMVIEINTSGFRKPIQEQYPSRDILELAYELNIPITFSSDAHNVDHIGLFYEEATSLAHAIGYNQCTIFRQRDRCLVDF
jgi:histidinol-phosphatase (PHP family)